ncbi:hypothetical protein Tco_1563667 [Tanacetum coccineum]
MMVTLVVLKINLNVTSRSQGQNAHLGRNLKCHTASSEADDTVVMSLVVIGGSEVAEGLVPLIVGDVHESDDPIGPPFSGVDFSASLDRFYP